MLGPVVEPVADLMVDAPGTVVSDPVACGAGCVTVELRGVALTAWEELEPPRSACGAKPVLAVDDLSTVVLSGCDVTWDVAAGVTGVVVTGWLLAVGPVVTDAFGEFVAVLTGWLSAAEADENDGDRPGDPPVDRPEAPDGPEENDPAEYGADEPGCTDIE